MIYSRFGSQVTKVLGMNEDAAVLTVVFEDSRDGAETVSIADLRADGGIQEIIDAGKAANDADEGEADTIELTPAQQADLRERFAAFKAGRA